MTQAMESSSRMRIPIAASSPALLRIELVDGEKLDDRDPEVLEIGNLLGQARKRAALGWCDPGVRTRSESLDVQLIDDGVSAGVSGASLEWKRHRTLAWQTAERRSSVGRTRMGARVAAELRREEDRRRVRIEQELLRIEAQSVLGFVWSLDPISVERGAEKLAHRDAAMPDVPSLVGRMLETKFKDWCRRVLLGVAQERDAGRVPRVERRIERVVRLHPLDPERPWTSRRDRAW
jgi:hypothetical protein